MAIAFVQASAITAGGSAGSATRTLTVTAGSLIIAAVSCSGGVASFSDSAGNTWNIDRQQGTTERAIIGSCVAASSGSITVTVTFSGNQFYSFQILEYSGPTASPLDKVAGSGGFGNGSISSSSTATTSQADELLIMVGSRNSANSPNTIVVAGSYTSRGANSGGAANPMCVGERIVSATGTYNAQATLGSTSGWNLAIATYKAADAGSGPLVDGRLSRSNLVEGKLAC